MMKSNEPPSLRCALPNFLLLRSARLWLLAGLFALSGAAWADPPGRVGYISLIDGQVWVRDVTSSEAFAPSINWPVSTGTHLETGMTSRAEIRIGSSTVRMDNDTRLDFARLDDSAIRIRLEAGTISVRHRNLDNALQTTVVTAGGTVSFVETGRYRVDANDNGVAVAVFQGAARWDSPTASYGARTGLRMEIGYDGYARSTDVFSDGFDDWVASRDRRDDRIAAARYVSPEMSGYEALDSDGSWQTTAVYGPVWYPRVVTTGWAPYRYGRWINYGAWGWTWVDDAPWGFAVSHYGRWAWVDGRWGWVPGAIVPRPVWAPALVAWAGGPGWSVSASFGAPAVGWVPLAPAEVFVPYYAATPRYCQVVNVAQVTNLRVINNYYANPGSQAYANAQVPGAVSAAAAGALVARGAVIPTPQQARLIRAVDDPRVAQNAFVAHRIAAPAVRNPVPIAVNAPAIAAARAAAPASNIAAFNGRPLPQSTLREFHAAPPPQVRPQQAPEFRGGAGMAAQAVPQRVAPPGQMHPPVSEAPMAQRPAPSMQPVPGVPNVQREQLQQRGVPAQPYEGRGGGVRPPQFEQRGQAMPQRMAPPAQALPPTPQRDAPRLERPIGRPMPQAQMRPAPRREPQAEHPGRNEGQRQNER